MDSRAYQLITAGPGCCAACHGENGEGRGDGFPRLDVQSPIYLADTLKAFRHWRPATFGNGAEGGLAAIVAVSWAAAIWDLISNPCNHARQYS